MFEEVFPPRALGQLDGLNNRLPAGAYLGGGTAIALHLGHRLSVDLDFFVREPFQELRLASELAKTGAEVLDTRPGTVHALWRDTAISVLHFPYKMLNSCVIWRGVEVAALTDLAAMKILAISQRAEKKDFFDLVALLEQLEPTELAAAVVDKFGLSAVNPYHLVRSLFYFDDAEKTVEPKSLVGLDWQEVQESLRAKEPELSAAFLGG